MARSFWQKVGITTDDSSEETTEATKPVETTAPQTISVTTPTVAVLTPQVNTIDDSEYTKLINDKLNELAGESKTFDFMKFISAVNALVSIVPDEATRFKVTYATNKANHPFTIESLELSADSYIKAVDDIFTEFKKWGASYVTKEIDGRNQELVNIGRSKEAKLAEISKLTVELDSLTSKENEIKAEIAEKSAVLDIKKATFASAKGKIENGLQTLKQNLRKYLA